MRNLCQYPISEDEVKKELDDIQIVVDRNSPIGNMSPVIRACIKQFIEKPEIMKILLEDIKV